MTDREKDDELDWVKLVKLIADAIRVAISIGIGIWWIVEFTLNPNHNVSTYFLAEHTYGLAVQCQQRYDRWELRVDAIETNATVTRWQLDREGNRSEPEALEISEKNNLTFPCVDEEVVAGLVWSIDQEDGVHFRAPRSLEIWEVER